MQVNLTSEELARFKAYVAQNQKQVQWQEEGPGADQLQSEIRGEVVREEDPVPGQDLDLGRVAEFFDRVRDLESGLASVREDVRVRDPEVYRDLAEIIGHLLLFVAALIAAAVVFINTDEPISRYLLLGVLVLLLLITMYAGVRSQFRTVHLI